MRDVVLGAGFGRLELTTRLSDQFGDDVDEGAAVQRTQVSAQRLFGRLERHEPDPSGATRPSHR
jgi:hypothetical protein